MNSPHILIVDDDREIRELLTGFLVGHGYRVDTAADGRAMLRLMGVGRFDLIVLDVMLPGEDGLALCRWLRTTSTLPVIMLTALAEETDRIIGLEMGADDYVVKPFSPRELLARIKAVLRRSRAVPQRVGEAAHILVFEGWRLDLTKREVYTPESVLSRLFHLRMSWAGER